MKKLIISLLLILSLVSCSLEKEDEIVNLNFLESSYSSEFHELDLSNQGLTMIPNFEKYLTGSYKSDVWSIDLSNNSISDIDLDKLQYFPNLKELKLPYNNLTDVKVDGLPLEILQLHKNNINKVDLTSLNKLSELTLGYNKLVTLNSISLPVNVTTLELQHNSLEDLNGLSKLKNLETLKLEFNNLEDNDLKEILNLENISSISIGQNKLSDKVEDTVNKLNNKDK